MRNCAGDSIVLAFNLNDLNHDVIDVALQRVAIAIQGGNAWAMSSPRSLSVMIFCRMSVRYH